MKLFNYMILLLLITTSHQRRFSDQQQIWLSRVLKHSDKCLMETGADYNLAIRLPYGEFVDDHKLKCFLLCIADNLFGVYEDGSIHHQNFLDILNVNDPKVLLESNIVDKCFSIKLIDHCESFYAVSKCLYKALEKVMTQNESTIN